MDRGKRFCRLRGLELNPEQESAMVAARESYPRMPDLVKTMIEGGASGRAVPSRKTDSGTGDQPEGLARV